jgi:hypothetical protein
MADGPAEKILSDKALLEENHLELPLSMQAPTPRKKGGRMNDIEKLHHLLGHWLEHNQEHAKSYLEWKDRAVAAGRPELGAILGDIAQRTSDLDELFRRAAEACR